MDNTKALEILNRQVSLVTDLKQKERSNLDFPKWQRDIEVALEKIFGAQSRHIKDFTSIRYNLSVVSSGTPDYEFQRAYVRGLDRASAILLSIIDEIKEYNVDTDEVFPDALSLLEHMCLRFHLIARQLRSLHSNRSTLEIEDEYDVQDLLHGLLQLHFNDIRSEEWVPSYAGGASRADFLLKKEQVIIEVKKTRANLSQADIGAQLLIDTARYKAHPDCKCLVCFIYDPEGRIGNPTGLERDLESAESSIRVRVIVGPKGF